jgi:hypothetical protein
VIYRNPILAQSKDLSRLFSAIFGYFGSVSAPLRVERSDFRPCLAHIKE